MSGKSALRSSTRPYRLLLSPAHITLAMLGLGGAACLGQSLTVRYSSANGKWFGENHWYSEQFIGGGQPLRTYYWTPPSDTSITDLSNAQVELTNSGGNTEANTGSRFRLSYANLWIHGDVTLKSGHVSVADLVFSSASVTVSGAGALWETTGDLSVGQGNDSNGTLTIENGATVKAGNYVFLGYGDRSTGTLNIGNYDRTTTAGILSGRSSIVTMVRFGNSGALAGHEGQGILNFNQTDQLSFYSLLYSAKPGLGLVVQRGTGTTKLYADNSNFTGQIKVESGMLWATNPVGAQLHHIADGVLRVNANYFNSANTVITGAGTLQIGGGTGFLNGSVVFAMSGGLIDLDFNYGTLGLNVHFAGSNDGNDSWALNKASLRVARSATFWANEGHIRVDALSGSGTIHTGYEGQGSFTFGVNNGSGTFDGVLADGDAPQHTGRYIKEGSGTQILTGANTFTGGLTVYGGFVQVNANTGLGAASSPLTLDGGGIKFGASFNNLRGFTIGNSGGSLHTNGHNVTLGSNVSGTGALIKTGSGTLTLTGNNSQNGGLSVLQGTVSVASDASIGAAGAPVNLNGGTLRVTNSLGINRPLTLGNSGGTIAVAPAQWVVWNGNVSGSGNATLSKSETGTLWVGGDINLGSVQVNSGLLVAAGGLNVSKNVVLGSGASLVLSHDTPGQNRDYQGSTTFTGTGTLVKTGEGEILWHDAAATFALGAGSLIDVQAGGFSAGNFGNDDWYNNRSDLRVDRGARFRGNEAYVRVDALSDGVNGGGTIYSGWNGAGNITIGVDNGSGTFSGVIADTDKAGGHIGSLMKDGTGTQVLTGNNTYTGQTGIINGTLVLTGDTKSSSFNIGFGDATLEFNLPTDRMYGATSFEGFGILRKTGAGSIEWGSGSATFALNSGSKIEVLGGTFVGGSYNNEVWTNNKADLHVAIGGTFSGVEAKVRVDALTGGGTITSGYNASNPGSFTFGVDNGSGTFSGVLANGSYPGRFIKEGTGTQALTGTNTFTGALTIDGGTLQLGSSGTVLADTLPVRISAGTLALGASLEKIGSLTVDGQGVLSIEIFGPGSYERLAMANGITLNGGTLRLTLGDGYVPNVGDVFDLLDWGTTISGAFATLDLPAGITWDTSRLYTDGTVSIATVPEPATLSLVLPAALFLSGFRLRRNRRRVAQLGGV